MVTHYANDLSTADQHPFHIFSFHVSEICNDDVRDALNTLSEVKAIGPDRISAKLLLMTSFAIGP